jgi:phosphohistidine phosphatase
VLRQTPDKVSTLLAVGHNPGFGELACALARDGAPDDLRRMQEKFPTAALAVLDFAIDGWDDAAFGGARLQRFVVPADLRGGEGDEAE